MIKMGDGLVRFIKGIVAFVLTFCMLAATVVCAAVVSEDTTTAALVSEAEVGAELEAPTIGAQVETPSLSAEIDGPAVSAFAPEIAVVGASEYSPRLTAPKKSNKYYYSNKNIFYKTGWGMPNCTCYAYGRAYEILGAEPNLCIYSAYLWYDYNKHNGIYAYGQKPKLGAIACWVYKDGVSGHVAVVEKITKDTIYYSNSAWGGSEFYVDTSPIDDPSGGWDKWVFQGFIYIGDYNAPKEEEQQGDVYRITSDNGVNMRKGAGTSYSIVSAIPCGASVTVTKTKKAGGYTWGYTSYMGISGWFVTDFAELVYSTEKEDSTIPEKDEHTNIMGDADFDGKLTVLDATLFQRILAELEVPTQYQLALADVDGNSVFNIMDTMKIRRILADLE
ncbi:MAG: CHAP domain-containing protein [Ruminococcaceae bacterium]|nr:CHAP domain-containing protein [Oscillospiraceae bacterium]